LYDFSAYPTIVDVGGGHGPLLAAILAGAPASRSVLYDLPRVVASAPNLLRERDVADRLRIAEGSFFDSVPRGGDAYILKNITHDWPDEKAVQILRNVRTAGGPRPRCCWSNWSSPSTTVIFPENGWIWRCC
jgi:hypothetical protein